MDRQKDDRDALQRAFKARRHVLGLTQQEVADAAHTSKSTVSRFENAKSEPDPDTLDRLISAVNSSVPDLERLAAASTDVATEPAPPATDVDPSDVPPGLASATPDQLVEYMHALIATVRFRHPERLSRLAAVLSQAHDRILTPKPGSQS